MNIEIIIATNEEVKESGFGSLEACNQVLESVSKMGHNVVLTLCENLEHINDVVKRKPDLVLLALKYIVTDGKTIWLSEFFEQNNINFSGSLKDALMYDSDKVLAKAYLKDKGISTPRYFTAVPGEYNRDYDIPINYPLFLKPIHSANYNDKDALALVKNFKEFENKVLSLYTSYKVPVLVEEYLDGKDFSVSIIKAEDGDMLVSAIEVVPPKQDKSIMFLNEEIKKEKHKTLAKIEDKLTKSRVENLAIDAYIDLDIRDFGQIHIKTNKSGHCYFMQANLVPNMTKGSSYFTEAFTMEIGLSYNEIIEFIVNEGIRRVN